MKLLRFPRVSLFLYFTPKYNYRGQRLGSYKIFNVDFIGIDHSANQVVKNAGFDL